MAQTYLQLVNTFITERGVNGAQQLTTVGGVTGEALRIANFIADADQEVCLLHENWNFLWQRFQGVLTVGSDILPMPAYTTGVYGSAGNYFFRRYDRGSLCLSYNLANTYNRPTYQEWRAFETQWDSVGPKTSSDTPQNWSMRPDGVAVLSHLPLTAQATRLEGWMRPLRLRVDGDFSPLSTIPVTTTTGLEYERIIIVRAKVLWAEAEGDQDVMQGALAEYQDLLEELRSLCLPSMEGDRSSQGDIQLAVSPVA